MYLFCCYNWLQALRNHLLQLSSISLPPPPLSSAGLELVSLCPLPFRLHNSASVFKALFVTGLAVTVRFPGTRYGQAGVVAVVGQAVMVIRQAVAATNGRSAGYRCVLRTDTGNGRSVGDRSR